MRQNQKQTMKDKFKSFSINYSNFIIFFVFYLTVLLGFYFNEDNLGGAAHDSIYHFDIVQKFNENFSDTFSNFGKHEYDLGTRNSPVFWIFMSILSKFFSIDLIRLLNTLIILATAIIFHKCLQIRYGNFDRLSLIILSTMIFLSPTLRSLAIWPYSLGWGLFFFIVSIYSYLKFQNDLNLNKSLIILINVIIASYIYPSFAVFYLFYFYKIFEKTKNTSLIIKILLISFICFIPCLIYLMSSDIFTIFKKSQGVGAEEGITSAQYLNVSNKILIIGSMILYFLMPVLNFKEIFNKIKNIKKLTLISVLLFCVANIYFFNFPHSTWGGGFFHKLSNIIFGNNYLFYFFSILSILTIHLIIERKFSNYLLLFILVLYNPQFTIYIKYFDPLIYVLFLTLLDFNLKKHFFDKTYAFYQFYLVIIFYYVAVYSKNIFLDFKF
tara:strand:+ start:614 stop:1930 length:1317 start_codon:yes stop_codon:yes gene_type:complete